MTALEVHPAAAVAAMPVEQARRLTDTIRERAKSIAYGIAELKVLIDQARTGGADIALGYASWTSYFADVMPTVHIDGPDERRAIVAYLREQGMSTRAIAPVVGVSQPTVVADLAAAGDQNRSPDGEIPPPVTGLDGKAYPPRPRPIVDPAPPPRPSGSPPTDDERAASDRRAADAIRKFLYGWPIAANLHRSANRDRTLAALDPHDRERFLDIEREHLR